MNHGGNRVSADPSTMEFVAEHYVIDHWLLLFQSMTLLPVMVQTVLAGPIT